jgi:hypothetical protein
MLTNLATVPITLHQPAERQRDVMVHMGQPRGWCQPSQSAYYLLRHACLGVLTVLLHDMPMHPSRAFNHFESCKPIRYLRVCKLEP